MTGGSISCADLILGVDGYASIDLLDGIITSDTLTMNTSSLMNIAGGTFVLDGNITDITTYGNIVANGGTGIFNYDYDTVNGVTAITAVPEPATLAILGLGSLLLIRRRKA